MVVREEGDYYTCACVRECVRACVRACARARACVCVRACVRACVQFIEKGFKRTEYFEHNAVNLRNPFGVVSLISTVIGKHGTLDPCQPPVCDDRSLCRGLPWPGPLLSPMTAFTKHHLSQFSFPFSHNFICLSGEDKG